MFRHNVTEVTDLNVFNVVQFYNSQIDKNKIL